MYHFDVFHGYLRAQRTVVERDSLMMIMIVIIIIIGSSSNSNNNNNNNVKCI